MFSSLKIDSGSNLARTKLSSEPDAASVIPPTCLFVGSSGLAYWNLSYISDIGLHYAGLNPTANMG